MDKIAVAHSNDAGRHEGQIKYHNEEGLGRNMPSDSLQFRSIPRRAGCIAVSGE
jgi:hypothetical protein